ncbi:MAG: methyltransferase [Candidatus Heimdallarchaeota archaeon]|nr:MAG: methyltransferase [Candidatus Heimdallarchaeota archaeon]
MSGKKWFPTEFRLISPQGINWTRDEFYLYNQILDYVNTINSFHKGKIKLEQYTLPAQLIAFILVYVEKDLKNQKIVEFGSGTGRISLPLLKFFSAHLLCVDVDSETMHGLKKRLKAEKLEAELLLSAIEFLETYSWKDSFKVTIMNPPFGTRRRGIDIVFLEKALIFSKKVISIHKSNQESRKLIDRISRNYNKSCEILMTLEFPILPLYAFHKKKRHYVCVDVYRISEIV